jgi:hypothetical protein
MDLALFLYARSLIPWEDNEDPLIRSADAPDLACGVVGELDCGLSSPGCCIRYHPWLQVIQLRKQIRGARVPILLACYDYTGLDQLGCLLACL